MKTLTRIFAPLAVLGALASCQMYKIDTQMTPEKAAASIRMECSAVDVYTLASQDPDAITFNVSANTPWTLTLSSGADWLDVTPASSASSSLITDVVVIAKSNTSLEDRSATLTLRGENIAKTKVITIKQGRAGRLYVTPPSKDFSAAGGPLNFTIQTNHDWEVRCDQSWISFNREKGTPDPEGRTLTIVAVAEPSDVLERSATITVKAGDEEESFDISQTGSFSLTALSDPFESAGGDQTFSLKTDLSWEIVADQTWLTFDQTSGIGDATITATAAANEGALRKAVVTISAGGVENSFEVAQKGFTFEIVVPASTELPGMGGEVVLGVNAASAWEPATEVEGWSVEKIDATSFKVKMAPNNLFVQKAGKVKIVSDTATAELELTQLLAVELKGHYEMLEDGSVKLYGDQTSNITIIGGFRYGSIDLKISEASFADDGNFWFECKVKSEDPAIVTDCQLYNWLTVGKTRLRAEGTANGKSMKADGTSYMSETYSITKDELNVMTSYKMTLTANAENPSLLDMEFIYNGASKCLATCQNPFLAAGLVGDTFIGFHAVSASSWVILKSCDVTVTAEE
ncbi:MAG: BACON domain-containing protein [Candidatus Cryptobacteroides sp.]|nr:BACON domain-containing protein [Candidatus Cryptobacteroides sp.]